MNKKRKAVTKAKPKLVKTFDEKKFPNIIPTYTVTLKVGPDTYKSSADDVTEALLGLEPEKISNRTVFELAHNGMKSVLMRNVPMAKRIITNRMTATMTGRALVMLLK